MESWLSRLEFSKFERGGEGTNEIEEVMTFSLGRAAAWKGTLASTIEYSSGTNAHLQGQMRVRLPTGFLAVAIVQ